MLNKSMCQRNLQTERLIVYDVFRMLGISYKVYEHPPINSAADRVSQGVEVDGVICKNLFLRNNNKSHYYLYTLPIDKRADLAALQKLLNDSRLSFGDADALWEKLRITPGSVSLLNIIGERWAASAEAAEMTLEGCASINDEVLTQEIPSPTSLKFLIDSETLSAEPGIGLHPNDNSATIVFKADRIPSLLEYYKADFEFIDVNGKDV